MLDYGARFYDPVKSQRITGQDSSQVRQKRFVLAQGQFVGADSHSGKTKIVFQNDSQKARKDTVARLPLQQGSDVSVGAAHRSIKSVKPRTTVDQALAVDEHRRIILQEGSDVGVGPGKIKDSSFKIKD